MGQLDFLLYENKFSKTSITYSYDHTASLWDGLQYGGAPSFTSNKGPISPVEGSILTDIFHLWDDFSAFSITANQSNATGKGDINLFHADLSGAEAALFQNNTDTAAANPDNSSETVYARSEIVFGVETITNSGLLYWQAMHEIGHALGLSHPNDDISDTSFDMTQTVMVGRNASGQSLVSSSAYTTHWAITPMAYDIAALEEQYGTFDHNETGGTVYNATSLGITGELTSQTIVDTDGLNDEIDLSGIAGNHLIDLHEAIEADGSWADAKTVINKDDTASGTSEKGDEWIFIARGSVIENAKGGSGDDEIIGNSSDNILDGQGGKDTVDYSDETTTLSVTVEQNETVVFGSEVGLDTLISIEKIEAGSGNDTFKINSLALAGKLHLDGGDGSDILDFSLLSGTGVTIDGNKIVGTDITFEGFETIILSDQGDFVRNVDNMIIYTRDGEDQVEVGSNIYILDASVDDRLTYFGRILDDGIKQTSESSGSNNPWTDWNNQGIRYGYNQNHDLVVQRLGEGNDDVDLTYVANHHTDLFDSTASTFGISIYELEYATYGL